MVVNEGSVVGLLEILGFLGVGLGSTGRCTRVRGCYSKARFRRDVGETMKDGLIAGQEMMPRFQRPPVPRERFQRCCGVLVVPAFNTTSPPDTHHWLGLLGYNSGDQLN